MQNVIEMEIYNQWMLLNSTTIVQYMWFIIQLENHKAIKNYSPMKMCGIILLAANNAKKILSQIKFSQAKTQSEKI